MTSPPDRLQSLSIITLGTADLARSKRFCTQGFSWSPVFEADDVCFYQMNGFVLGAWVNRALEKDLAIGPLPKPGASNRGHNLARREDVAAAIKRLVAFGAVLIWPAIEQPYGGLSGYIADPDGRIWEMAWNPAWTIGADGRVTFGA